MTKKLYLYHPLGRIQVSVADREREKNISKQSDNMFIVDILFLSNHNIHKSLCGLCFWASDFLINRIYKNLSTKGSEAQK